MSLSKEGCVREIVASPSDSVHQSLEGYTMSNRRHRLWTLRITQTVSLEGCTKNANNMAHINLTYHIVWRTKRSERSICEEHERDLYAYILGICKSKKCHLYRINSMPDHVHMCVEVHPTIALSEFIRIIKQETSKWMKKHCEWYAQFGGWGNGYAAFSYSVKERPTVIEYIKNQKEHHKVKTFREEYEGWLREMGMDPANDLFFKE